MGHDSWEGPVLGVSLLAARQESPAVFRGWSFSGRVLSHVRGDEPRARPSRILTALSGTAPGWVGRDLGPSARGHPHPWSLPPIQTVHL